MNELSFSNRTKNVTRTIRMLYVDTVIYVKADKKVIENTVPIWQGCTKKEFETAVSKKFDMDITDFNIVSAEIGSIMEKEVGISLKDFINMAESEVLRDNE